MTFKIFINKLARYLLHLVLKTLEALRIPFNRLMKMSFYRYPFRKVFINIFSVLFGITELMLLPPKWGLLKRYYLALKPETGFLSFVLRYNFQHTRNSFWANTIFDSKDPGEFITVTGREVLIEAMSEGRGGIVLGAHYGPSCYTYVLSSVCGLDIKLLVNENTDRYFKEESLGKKHLIKDRMAAYFSSQPRHLVAERDELSLVKHIKRRGVALILNDIIAPSSSGESVIFLERALPFSIFPFKLAVRYNVPVIFFSFFYSAGGKFSLHFSKCSHPNNAKKGLNEYVAFVEELVLQNPYIWWQSLETYSNLGLEHAYDNTVNR